jgi:predicted ATPase
MCPFPAHDEDDEDMKGRTNGKGKAPLRFLSLQLENWRNFSKVDVALASRVILVGPNASGKSNLLDVFRFLHDIVSVGGGFQEAVTRRGGVSSIRCYAARQFPEIMIRVGMGGESGVAAWEYELSFTQEFHGKRPLIKRERVTRDGNVLFTRPDPDDEKDPERLTETHLEQVNVNQDFREIAEFFRSIRYLHIVPQLVREPDRSVGKHHDPYGGDFLEQIAHTTDRIQAARLRRIQSALRVAVPQLKELKMERDVRGTPHLKGRYEHWRPHGAWQNEEHFSDGTLRLMGLLWAVLDEAGPLLLEEPELSLHTEVVRHLPQMLARTQRKTGRQLLISTHSSELLQDRGIGLDEVLLLRPDREGTVVWPAASIREIPSLLEGGLSLAEAVLPQSSPRKADQLTFFPD